MKKKILVLVILLSLILPFVYMIGSHAAGPDVTFSVGSMNGQRGQTYTVIVNMNCSANLTAANLVLTYNSNVLEYIPYYNEDNEIDSSQNRGSLIANANTTVFINSDTAGTLKIGYMSTKSVEGKSGEFLKFKFKVKSNAAYGNSAITLDSTTLKDDEGNNLTPQFTNGTISILSAITLNNSSMTMTVGDTNRLIVSTSNGSIIDRVNWTNTNNSVLSISPSSDTKTLNISALAAGTTSVTATVGGVSASCSITVNPAQEEYTISINTPAWRSLPISQIRALSVTFNPSSASNGKTITWSSSNTNIATINSSTGAITAKANGSTTITATDGNKSATYVLNVSRTLGDIDNDSNITSYDAYRALVLYSEEASGETIDQNDVVVLDVERNGSMSSNDAYLILKHSVGLISSFN